MALRTFGGVLRNLWWLPRGFLEASSGLSLGIAGMSVFPRGFLGAAQGLPEAVLRLPKAFLGPSESLPEASRGFLEPSGLLGSLGAFWGFVGVSSVLLGSGAS